MKYNLFTLLPYESIPPEINTYIADGSAFALPTGLSFSKTTFYPCFTVNSETMRHILGVVAYNTRDKGVVATYREIASKIAANEGYLKRNHLKQGGDRRLESSFGCRLLQEHSIVRPDLPIRITQNGRRDSVTINYVVPSRLVRFQRIQDLTPLYVKYDSNTRANLLTAIEHFKNTHDYLIQRLMEEFRVHQINVKTDPSIIKE
jgi:hypothetical protein